MAPINFAEIPPNPELEAEKKRIIRDQMNIINEGTAWGIKTISATKILFTIFLGYLGYIRITQEPWTFLDFFNAFTHEFGHSAFSLLFSSLPLIGHAIGIFMTVLGGPLTQTLLPLLTGVYFFWKKNWYSALFCLFWMGDNLIMDHYYMADARCKCSPQGYFSPASGIIYDPTYHDWNYMLSHLGLLNYDTVLASIENVVGIIIILIALALMVYDIIINLSKAAKN